MTDDEFIRDLRRFGLKLEDLEKGNDIFKYHVLDDDHNLVKATAEEWAVFFEDHARRKVDRTSVLGCDVSTVFLGTDHSFGYGRPKYFETMIFAPRSYHEVYCVRTQTWNEAKAAHREAIRALRRNRCGILFAAWRYCLAEWWRVRVWSKLKGLTSRGSSQAP